MNPFVLVLNISALAAHWHKLDGTISDIPAVNVAAGHYSQGLGFAPGMSKSREESKLVLKLSVKPGDICEANGRSQRASMYLDRGKGENPLFMSVQLYHWVKRNMQAYGRNVLAFPLLAWCEGP